MAYDFVIVHESSQENVVAGVLSRYKSMNLEQGTFDLYNIQETTLPSPIGKSVIKKTAMKDKVINKCVDILALDVQLQVRKKIVLNTTSIKMSLTLI